MGPLLFAEWHVGTPFVVFACIAILLQSIVIIRALIGTSPSYRLTSAPRQPLDSEEFLCELESVTDSKVNRRSSLEELTNGDHFYEAELQAISSASKTVCLEAYIFQTGKIAERFRDALTERAQAGVKVKVLLDGLGSVGTKNSYFEAMTKAGGQLGWYHSLKWNNIPDYNNRSHRELLVIDGKVGFIGGAGIADHWYTARDKHPRWRDTMVRVEGDAVTNLQATFAENWLEACGELIFGEEYFPQYEMPSDGAVLVISSTPSAGGSTRARTLFQVLIASAQKSIFINTPYFLPDSSMIDELLRAHHRGVKIRLIVPGRKSDHILTRSASRLSYGRLLKEGVEIFEYQTAMIHAKILMIDGLWSVVGSTNMDHRSFGLNDEVNMAVRAPAFTARLERDFARDVAESRRITYEEWRHRSIWERAPEVFGWALQRQQ
ncbi:MAG: phospholipase D-like domain-containing protein [Terriglobales bacterium]